MRGQTPPRPGGYDRLRNPRLNKGTAFTDAERRAYGLEGLLPPAVMNIELQVARRHAEIANLDSDLQKYLVLSDLQERNEKIDRITVANELMKFGELEACDGLSYLVSLDDGLPQIPNLDSYIRIVKDKSVLRRIIFASPPLPRATSTYCAPASSSANRTYSPRP